MKTQIKSVFFILALITSGLSLKTSAQDHVFEWAKQMGGTSHTVGNSITIDNSGNVYTVGHFSETADFDPGAGTYELTSAGVRDIFISKLDASGNFVWAKRLGGTQDCYGYSIAVDDSGNVYTTGTFSGTADFDPGAGTYELTSAGGNDIFISKLNASGDFVWAKRLGGSGGHSSSSIAVDDSGNVYTTGRFMGTVDFDPGVGTYQLTSAGLYDNFISKLNASGDFVWAKRMGGTNHIWSRSIALDDSGNIYTTGYFQGTADFDPGPGTHELTSAGSRDIFISKLDASGNFVWAKLMGGTGNNSSESIALDGSGNVYITGWFFETANFDPGAGTYELTSVGFNDVFVSKLDASGNFVWAKQLGGASGIEAWSIAVNSIGNVYTTGTFQDTVDFDPGPGTYELKSTEGSDIFVSKIDASGNFVWAKQLEGTSWNRGNSIAVDDNGNVYATGRFSGTVDFDPGAGSYELTSIGNNDVLVHKMSPCVNTSSTQTITACDIYVWNGNPYTVSGTYYDTIPNAAGCDSLMTLNLTINTVDTSVTISGSTLIANAVAATYQWLDCDNDNIPISGATNQSYEPGVSGSFAVEVTQNNCTDTSGCHSLTFVGLNEFGQINFSVYPNPTTGGLTIQLGDFVYSEVTVVVRNSIGQVTMRKNYTSSNKLDLIIQGAPGIYFVEIRTGDKSAVLKVIKN